MKVRLTTRSAPDGMYLDNLTVGREYEVLGIEADDFRLLDDDKQPYLFPAECFEVADPTEPEFWICETGDDGERYCYPREWNCPGFFEDYFDGISSVQEQFWGVWHSRYADSEGGV